MKVIAKIDYLGLFEKGEEYKIEAIVLEGFPGSYDPGYFEFIGNVYEACGKYIPQIGKEYPCRRKEIGTEKFQFHKTSKIQVIRQIGSKYYYMESQNNRYWLRIN
mgnify:CR=1 FL=1